MFHGHHGYLKIHKSFPWNHHFLIQWQFPCINTNTNLAQAPEVELRIWYLVSSSCVSLYIQPNLMSFSLTAFSQKCPKSTSFSFYLSLPHTRSPSSPFFYVEQLPKWALHLRKGNVLVVIECDWVHKCLAKHNMCKIADIWATSAIIGINQK